jgi:hypothetical protein
MLVAAGFLAGALTAYYLLWRVHALVPGHPLARRSAEVFSPPDRPPRTIPPSPTPTPTAAETGTLPTPS